MTRLYDELDFQRAVQAYIWATPAVALDSLRIANKRDWGVDYNGVGVVNKFTGLAVMALTGNSTTIYAASSSILSGMVQWSSIHRRLPMGSSTIIGSVRSWKLDLSGPTKARAENFSSVPPGYRGDLPKSYFVSHSLTNRIMYLARGFVKDGDVKSAVDTLAKIRIYPFLQAAHPPETRYSWQATRV